MISGVRSVEPSLMMTHLTGCIVCASIARIVFSRFSSSFRAGVMRRHLGSVTIDLDPTDPAIYESWLCRLHNSFLGHGHCQALCFGLDRSCSLNRIQLA